MVCFNHRNTPHEVAAWDFRGSKPSQPELSELLVAWERLLDATDHLIACSNDGCEEIDPDVTKLIVSILNRCQSLRWIYESELNQPWPESSLVRTSCDATKTKLNYELYSLKDKLSRLYSPDSSNSVWLVSASQLAENFSRLTSRLP